MHKGGAVFKSNKTGKVDQFATGEVDAAYWMRVARGYELKIVLSNGTQFKFEGFKESVSNFTLLLVRLTNCMIVYNVVVNLAV